MFKLRMNCKICTSIILVAVTPYVYAAECNVATYSPHDNQRIHGHVGTYGGTVFSSTERCAQILLKCNGYGSDVISANELIATFADGNKRAGYGKFESFRLHGDESKIIYACFGSSEVPITNIEGEF